MTTEKTETSIEPAPDKIGPPFSCPLGDAVRLNTIDAVKKHVSYSHSELGPRGRSLLTEEIFYGGRKYV